MQLKHTNSKKIESIPQTVWKEAFSAPSPQRKAEFLEYLEKESAPMMYFDSPSIGIGFFLLSQIAYIRKRVYLISLLVLVLAIIAADYAGVESIWYIAAMMPFVALCMVTESARSETYGMAELEMASRFSIKSILMARFGTIGLVHMVLLCILIPVVRHSTFYSFVYVGIHLLVPYLAASVLEFAALRRFRGKEAISVCMVISLMVSLLNMQVENLLSYLFGARKFFIWVVLAVYLLVRVVREYKAMVNQTEEWIA